MYWPTSLLCRVTAIAVWVFNNVTVAPGTAPPLASTTAPWILPRNSCADKAMESTTEKTRRSADFLLAEVIMKLPHCVESLDSEPLTKPARNRCAGQMDCPLGWVAAGSLEPVASLSTVASAPGRVAPVDS